MPDAVGHVHSRLRLRGGRRSIADVVLVDACDADAARVSGLLRQRLPHARVRHVRLASEALATIRSQPPDLAILAERLPDAGAADLLTEMAVARGACMCPAIVLMDSTSERSGIRLMRLGAGDFLPKQDLSDDKSGLAHLTRAIGRCFEQHRITRRAALYRATSLRKRRRERRALDEAEVLRGQSERARTESEQAKERFDLSLEAAELGIWDWTPADGRVVHNQRLLAMLGYAPGEIELNYQTWRGLLHPDDAVAANDALETHLAGRSPEFRVECRLRTRESRYKWILCSGRVVARDRHGNPLRVAGVHIDVDSRKRAELGVIEAKNHAETVQQQLVDILISISDAFVFVDREWRYTYVNPKAEEHLGLSAAQLVGRTVWEAIPDFAQSPFGSGLRKAMEQRQPATAVAFLPSLRRWFDARFYPAEEGVSIFFLDVTEQKRQERQLSDKNAQLQQRTAQLNALLGNAPVGFAFFDREYYYLRLNRVLADISNRRLEEHYGHTLREILPAAADSIEPLIGRVFDTGKPSEAVEIDIAPGEGTGGWWQCSCFPVTDEGGQIHAVGAIVLDITDRKRAEEQLRQAKEQAEEQRRRAEEAWRNAEYARVSAERAKELAEEASRAKSEFLAVLSHELRTPLTPVLAGAQMLEAELEARESQQQWPEAAETLAMIRRNVELEVRLIDDLLDLTRITRGKLQLARKRIDINRALQHVLEIVRGDIEQKGLYLEADLQADPGGVSADPARLQQVLWNLLKNSVKFTDAGGRITVRTSNRPLPGNGQGQGEAERQLVVVEVIDTGIGIEPGVLPGVFNAFEQGGERVTRTFGGLGLGLAITKALVDAHGGTIRAASDGPGRGATFTVTLPAKPLRPPSQEPIESHPPAAPHSRSVLLIEDHPDTARLMARFLRAKLKLEVTVASTIDQALRACDHLSASGESRPFDLIISDIGLPDGSGTDLLTRLSAAGHRPPAAIALSGYGTEEDVKRSRYAGFSEHLTKPVDLDHFAAAVRRALRTP